MDYGTVFVIVLVLSLDVYSEPPFASAQTTSELEKVKTTATLTGVLKEYLDDIETVELAVSKCATGHRGRHLGAATALVEALDRCVVQGRSGNALVNCVENQTQRVISDVRQHITALKNCVDNI